MKTGHQEIRELDSMTKPCILRLFDCKIRRIQAGLFLLIVIICSSVIVFDSNGNSFSIRFYSGIR